MMLGDVCMNQAGCLRHLYDDPTSSPDTLHERNIANLQVRFGERRHTLG